MDAQPSLHCKHLPAAPKIQSYDRKQNMAAPIVFFVKVYELVSRIAT